MELEPGGQTISVGGVHFAVTRLNSAADWLTQKAVHDHDGTAVRLSNAYCVALAHRDSVYRDVLNGPGVTFPDGTPVAILMGLRYLGRRAFRTVGRVRGPSLFRAVLERESQTGLRHFFLGSSDSTLERIVKRLVRANPEAAVSGTYSPSYGALTNEFLDDCVNAVSAARANLIWVGLGTPKQDFVVAHLAAHTNAVVVGVGAAFDFYAGTVHEAPRLVQNMGFEWLFRFVSEPRRLWKRYIIGNAQFVRAVMSSGIRESRCDCV